jgi:hypothetical protein
MAGLARRARASEARAINEGSHVPAFDLVFRRRRALSLAIPDYGLEEIPPPNSMSESTSREHKAGPVQIALGPQSHQTFAGALAGVAAIGQSPAGKKVLITYVISTSRRHGALISLTQTWLGRSIATPESRYG